MRLSLKKGFSFGLTSGIITTLGLMVGLSSGTKSQLAVLGGIITIAIADSLSDAFGIHISEEAENKHSEREIWESTISTFLAKLVFAFSFVIPVIMLPLDTAIIASVIWGIFVLTIISYVLAKQQKARPLHVIGEHLAIALVVVVLTHYTGVLISTIVF